MRVSDSTKKALSIGFELFTTALLLCMVFILGYGIGANPNILIPQGTSMSPAINGGDIVICNQKYANLSTGDVASYSPPNYEGEVLHRVNWRNASHYEFKGDNKTRSDPYNVTKEHISCKMVVHFNSTFPYI